MVELFLFDLGKVLIDFDFAIAIKKLQERNSLNYKKIHALFSDSDLARLWDRGLLSEEAFYLRLKNDLNLKIKMEELIPIWNDIFSEKKESISLALSLKRLYKVMVMTNTNPWHLAYLRERFSWLSEFDGLVASCEVRLLKPEPEIYSLALAQAKVSPEDAIYVDDLIQNVQAAKSLGIDALQFLSFDHLANELKERGFELPSAGAALTFRNREL